jgi:hypothetical protein
MWKTATEIKNLTDRIKTYCLQKCDDLESPFIADFNTGQDGRADTCKYLTGFGMGNFLPDNFFRKFDTWS